MWFTHFFEQSIKSFYKIKTLPISNKLYETEIGVRKITVRNTFLDSQKKSCW